MKILVVDDDEIWKSQLKAKLEKLGHEVVTAYDALSGMEAFRRHSPEMVTTDLRMGKPNAGLILAYNIRDESPETRVIIMSDDFQIGFKEQALKAGVQTLFPKSLNLTLEAVRQVIS